MDSEWLQNQFKINPKLNKAGLARALGLDPPAVSKILSGRRQIKAHEYMAMRRYFGLPVDGEKASSGSFGTPAGSYRLSPLRSSALAEKPAEEDEDQWVMPASVLSGKTRAAPDQIRIFTIQDDAMFPDLKPGERVLVSLAETTPSPPGKFLLSDGVGHVVRQCEIVPQSDPAAVRVRALNASYGTFTLKLSQVRVIGRVIAKLEWL